MRLAYCGKTFDYFTGFRIDAGKWDAEKQAYGEIETFHPGFLVAQDT